MAISYRPPTQTNISNNGILTSLWLRYFNNFYSYFSNSFIKVVKLPEYTTAQRDSLGNLENFSMIGNTTTNTVQVFINGTWQDIT